MVGKKICIQVLVNLTMTSHWIYHCMEINNNISPPHAQIQSTINQEVVVGVEPQAIMGSLGKEAFQRRPFCIKQTPLNLQDYTCIATMDEPLTKSKALEMEDGSLWK